jgi:hypothetical protein
LGYAGGAPIHRNFSNAPYRDTWYDAALANALAGSSLLPKMSNMHITYNGTFSWYYGTDGQPQGHEYDLMTVVLHEITHGLNFSGSTEYAEGRGSWGYYTDLPSPQTPNIFDRFIRDEAGKALVEYSNNSLALGAALTSGKLWFHGPKALAANGGEAVRIYAPSSWEPASSYAHLDYATFIDTPNQLMIYAISPGVALHDPGEVTKGMLQDMGWNVTGVAPYISAPTPRDGARVSSYQRTSRILKVQVEAADSCTIFYGPDGSNLTSATVNPVNSTCSVDVPYGTHLTPEGTNFWYVEAENAYGTRRYPLSGSLSFTARNEPANLSPLLHLLLRP